MLEAIERLFDHEQDGTERSRRAWYVRAMRSQVVALVLVATAVGCGSSELEQSRAQSAQITAQTIRSAVMLYQVQHADGTCPTLEALIDDGAMPRSAQTTDPWGHAFRIECTAEDVIVRSPGPDGTAGNDDDIAARDTP